MEIDKAGWREGNVKESEIIWMMVRRKKRLVCVTGKDEKWIIHSFIHSGNLYSASSRNLTHKQEEA